jgi:hypothetical protein
MNMVISITHDEQHTYDTSFSIMFNILTDGEDHTTHFQNKPMRVIKNKLETLDFVNSKHSEYVQLSDALVGSWNYILKYDVDEKLAIDESTQNLAETVLSLITNYKYLHWMVSEKVTRKLSDVFKLT